MTEPPKRLTFIRCRIDDETIARSLCPDPEDPGEDQDRRDRISALCCERCQSLVDHMLTMDGGEAVCDGCLAAHKETTHDD